jgi:hypothetical protein
VKLDENKLFRQEGSQPSEELSIPAFVSKSSAWGRAWIAILAIQVIMLCETEKAGP